MIFNVNHETLAAADHHDIIDAMIPRSNTFRDFTRVLGSNLV